MRNAHGKESKIRGQETNIIQKNDILRGHNLGPRMACIWRFGKLVQIEVGGGEETDAKVWNWAPAKQDWLS